MAGVGDDVGERRGAFRRSSGRRRGCRGRRRVRRIRRRRRSSGSRRAGCARSHSRRRRSAASPGPALRGSVGGRWSAARLRRCRCPRRRPSSSAWRRRAGRAGSGFPPGRRSRPLRPVRVRPSVEGARSVYSGQFAAVCTVGPWPLSRAISFDEVALGRRRNSWRGAPPVRAASSRSRCDGRVGSEGVFVALVAEHDQEDVADRRQRSVRAAVPASGAGVATGGGFFFRRCFRRFGERRFRRSGFRRGGCVSTSSTSASSGAATGFRRRGRFAQHDGRDSGALRELLGQRADDDAEGEQRHHRDRGRLRSRHEARRGRPLGAGLGLAAARLRRPAARRAASTGHGRASSRRRAAAACCGPRRRGSSAGPPRSRRCSSRILRGRTDRLWSSLMGAHLRQVSLRPARAIVKILRPDRRLKLTPDPRPFTTRQHLARLRG